MKRREITEAIARALCRFEGRNEDYETNGEPAWRRYESQARAVANVLDLIDGDKN